MKLIIVSSVIIAFIAISWSFFTHYWIYIPGIIFNLRTPVLKNQFVTWSASSSSSSSSSGTDTSDPLKRDPNIILILLDDIGYNDISFYGGGIANGKIKTPNIDSIGHNGISFSNAYAGHATCAPSRAALLTGKYATKIGYEFTPTHPGYVKLLGTSSKSLRKGLYHKEVVNKVSFDNMTLPLSEITLGQALQKAGYRTFMMGKWHLGDTNETKPMNRGFDETLSYPILSRLLKYGDVNAVDWRLKDMLDKFVWANIPYAVSKNGGRKFEPKGYLTDYFANEASKIIQINKNNPFFLYFSLSTPHTPIQALKSDYDELAKYIPDEFDRVYGAMILGVDRAVGTILKTLEETGLKDNTIVIFTNDNGAPNYLMNHNLNKPLRGWKASFFEGGIRVPLFIQWPLKIKPGLIFDDIVSHIDIFPTLLSVTKAGGADLSNIYQIPIDNTLQSSLKDLYNNLDGVNLLPFINKLQQKNNIDQNENENENELINNSNNINNNNNDNNNDDEKVVPHKSLYFRSGHYSAIRVDDWKLQVCGNPNKMWLFNLKDDPSESLNLVDLPQYSTKLQEMLNNLNEVASQQVEPIWPAMTETAILIDKLFEFNETLEDEYIYWPN